MQLSIENIDKDVENLFEYYRRTGFPNYNKSKYTLQKEVDKLINTPNCINESNKIIGQSMVGCGVLWTYFPHWIDVKCNDSPSVSDVWNDDEKLKALIRKTYLWKLRHNELSWTDNRIRQNAKVYGAKQSVSNFRPTVARDIYNKFGTNNAKVLDMCSGFGGRLLGFAASYCAEYVGTDPSTKTYDGLIELATDIKQILSNKKITIYNQPFEDLDVPKDYFDIAFTSPPYFNTEVYSNESNNSCNRYPTYKEWLYGFLKPMISKAVSSVKPGGYIVINIADVKNAPSLSKDCYKLMEQCSANINIDTYYMALSSIAGKGVKYEPVFIMKK